jgi:hypothetical protein
VVAHPATTNTLSLILFCLVIAILGSIPLIQVSGHRADCPHMYGPRQLGSCCSGISCMPIFFVWLVMLYPL